jgi:polygalacturonase
MKGLAVGLVMGLGWVAVGAQDTRTVTEPVIPKACVVLKAELTSTPDGNGGKLREEDEGKLDTQRIQSAMDTCGAGMAVELAGSAGKNAFLTGPLDLKSGVTLLIDKGVTLYGSRDPKVYDMNGTEPIVCGTSLPRPGQFGQEAPAAPAAPARRGGCRPLISAVNVTNAAIMGDGTIDGRGYAKLIGKDFSWWEMARKAEPKNDIYFSTRLLVASHADGLILYRITLHNSPNFHVSVNQTNGFTAWGVHLLTPVDKKLDARNTDGIDPGTSTNVTVAHSWIDNGDDNIAIKANVQHMSVLDNHFYTGHGMSIGSEATGDAYLLVDGLTEDHTTSGIRIKSNVTRGGYDHDLTYKNICMRGVPNPIAISPYYTNQTTEGFVDPGYKGTKIPDYKKIVLQNIVSETAGDVQIAGIDEAHRTEVTLDNVVVKGITAAQVHLAFVDVTLAGAGASFDVSKGNNVKVMGSASGTTTPVACTGKFVPFR